MATKFLSIIIADNGDITIKGVHDTKAEACKEVAVTRDTTEGVRGPYKKRYKVCPAKVRSGSAGNGFRPFVRVYLEQTENGWELKFDTKAREG